MAELVDVDTESLGGIPRGLCPGEIYLKMIVSLYFNTILSIRNI